MLALARRLARRRATLSPSPRIINGSPAPQGKWPAQGFLEIGSGLHLSFDAPTCSSARRYRPIRATRAFT
jgi:secreted trypsin-like serine protease